jgi:hypothetical protein
MYFNKALNLCGMASDSKKNETYDITSEFPLILQNF